MKKILWFLISALLCLHTYAQVSSDGIPYVQTHQIVIQDDTLLSEQADTVFQNIEDYLLLKFIQNEDPIRVTWLVNQKITSISDSLELFLTDIDTINIQMVVQYDCPDTSTVCIIVLPKANTDSLKNLDMTLRETLTFLKVIRQDLRNSPDDIRALKKECIRTYKKWFYSAFWLDLGGPLMWMIYFNHRNAIHTAIYNYCYEADHDKRELDLKYDDLDAFCSSYRKIRNGTDCEQYLKLVQYTKEALTKNQYRLFCYGESVNINGVGDTPSWYMPKCKSNYLRRLFFTGFRNAYVQGNMLNRTTGIITDIERTYDKLDNNQIFKNRGTGNTAAGQALEWYKDNNGKMWFFYINTKAEKNRLFYFGAVGRNGRALGKYILRFELSSRTCEPVNGGKAKRNIND